MKLHVNFSLERKRAMQGIRIPTQYGDKSSDQGRESSGWRMIKLEMNKGN